MTIEEAVELAERKWGDHGRCLTCGWQGALYEYGDTALAIAINEANRWVELWCLSDYDDTDEHVGVRIPFD